MSSSRPIFGNFSSAQPSMKSPKSPKGVIIENPLLKNAQFSYGVSTLSTQPTSSALQTMPRSPLLAVTPNRDNIRRQQEHKGKASKIATPGPPPKMSLSLMGSMAMPVHSKSSNGNDPQTEQIQQRSDTLKAPAMVSTPIPVASPPLLEKMNRDTDMFFGESSASFSSESLVADHWVVAHGYTSPNEYKELLGILSSFGIIQSQESGGNWLAVLYESRLSAEKALTCQPFLLSNTLCGISRGTSSLMQKLSSGKGGKQLLIQGGEESAGSSRDGGNRIGHDKGKLKERDILMLENTGYESRKPFQPKSTCERLLSWYFGWEDWEDHPHSD